VHSASYLASSCYSTVVAALSTSGCPEDFSLPCPHNRDQTSTSSRYLVLLLILLGAG